MCSTADPNDYRWSYSYDNAGNVDRVTDPSGAVTDFDFNLAGSANPGTVSAVRDANGNPPTLYEAYDVSGQPSRIKDPLERHHPHRLHGRRPGPVGPGPEPRDRHWDDRA